MADSLSIDTTAVRNCASKFESISGQVRNKYTEMKNLVQDATRKGVWYGASSSEFLKEFEEFEPGFLADLDALDRVHPTMNSVAGGYDTTEEENVSSAQRNFNVFRDR